MKNLHINTSSTLNRTQEQEDDWPNYLTLIHSLIYDLLNAPSINLPQTLSLFVGLPDSPIECARIQSIRAFSEGESQNFY